MSERATAALRAVDPSAVDAEITDVLGVTDPDWEFALSLWVRYEHPDLRTLAVNHQFRARPTDGTATTVDHPDRIHERREWWLADGKPLQGELPFHVRPRRAREQPTLDLSDDAELWGFAHEAVLVDPPATLDGLLYRHEDDPTAARRLLADR